ncbi:hypothetical protein A6F68_02070 [Tsuneonella dongtanensis]|uniref:PilZ domain-containing protein n=2 Tax=Tsuneonella dongtanensis TaxID=692370 RepID=A0A1B2AEK0_9SPHN|nr:hypothetical protein A6F68_02070 [Tsuneonella dongtanensis]
MTTMTHGILGDISETGARFEAAEPPGKGATALLRWGTHEAVCTVIWHDDGACGVWFQTPLSAELVAETAALDRVVELPIASVGNITQGRKRSMGFLKRVRPEDSAPVETEPAAPPIAKVDVPSIVGEMQFRRPHPDQVMEREPEAEQRFAGEITDLLEAEGPHSAPGDVDAGPSPASFGRTTGLSAPTGGHTPTLATLLARYRRTGSWED